MSFVHECLHMGFQCAVVAPRVGGDGEYGKGLGLGGRLFIQRGAGLVARDVQRQLRGDHESDSQHQQHHAHDADMDFETGGTQRGGEADGQRDGIGTHTESIVRRRHSFRVGKTGVSVSACAHIRGVVGRPVSPCGVRADAPGHKFLPDAASRGGCRPGWC